MAWCDSPLVGLDFETTGIDPLNDQPVQAALVWCDGRGASQRQVWLIDPERDIPTEAEAVHGISTAQAREHGWSLAESAWILHRALSEAERSGVGIVAMNASFDVTIAECLFRRVGLPSLRWRGLVDPLVIDRHVDPSREGKRCLDALCETYAVAMGPAHDAGNDAAAAVGLARTLGRRWPEAGSLSLDELTSFEAAWHRKWAHEFNALCTAEGRLGLPPEEFEWPIRRPVCATAGTAAVAQSARDRRTMSMSSSVDRGLTTAMRIAVWS